MDVTLVLNAAEQHVVAAAFGEYRGLLLRADAAGGDAAEAAQIMGPIFERVDRRLRELMYASFDPALAMGDHHVGIGR